MNDADATNRNDGQRTVAHINRTGVLRLAQLMPYGIFGTPAARTVVERNILVFNGAWLVLLGALIEPALYVAVMGLGVGGLVGELDGGLTYGEFVGAGLLASSAMNAVVMETFNIYFKLEYDVYTAMTSTPLRPKDIAIGELMWAVIRVMLYSVCFLAVLVVMGLVRSWTAIFAVPMAMLIGFAFGAIAIYATTFMRSVHDFDLLQVAIVPMFLFSGIFYPLSIVPTYAKILTWCSPLYHGAAGVRALTTGHITFELAINVAVLAGLGTIGVLLASSRFQRLLRDET